ncbi:calmodulin-beta-like isoform X2 [Bolinopsis microptera]|uniref:calmodulin-beta-like isoform X2 n=1 Tax=Bolinopsis microptera TaxID=2820187 RepID=UPI003078D69B
MSVSSRKGVLNKLSSPTGLTDGQVKAAFRIFDKSKKGVITRGDIRKVLVVLGQEPGLQEMDVLMEEIDVDGDGTISLDEFKTMMERLMESNEEDDRELLEDTFNDFDVSGDGLIGVEDLLHVYRKLGDDEITIEEVEQMIVDATGTPKRKKATFEEFKAVLKEY